MSIITDYYKQAELAFAAYANLSAGIFGKDYTDALQDGGKGMSEAQATAFAATYTVVDQYTGVTGVSATIFKDKAGKTYLAIRGTQSPGDITADYILAVGIPSYLNPQFIQLQGQISQWLADDKLTSGFTVAGHSLGGYLAAAVKTYFSAESADVYTFNAPGLGAGYGNILDAFRAAFGLSDTALINGIINVRGTAGISLISGIGAQLSPPVMIESESSLNPVANHSIVGLTDALAVYNLFAQADASLTIGEITTILTSSAGDAARTLESVVTVLGELLVTNFMPRTGSEYNGSGRDNLYTDIQAIAGVLGEASGLNIEVLAATDAEGNATPFTATAIEALAQGDIAYRYALVHLNAFAVLGANYSNFNQNGELDLFNPATGDGQLSAAYITDRSAMLAGVIEAHIVDSVSGSTLVIDATGSDTIYYKDLATNLTLRQGQTTLDPRYIVFGSKEGETLTGGFHEDHLYGMDGNDTLIGNGGDDYLWKQAA